MKKAQERCSYGARAVSASSAMSSGGRGEGVHPKEPPDKGTEEIREAKAASRSVLTPRTPPNIAYDAGNFPVVVPGEQYKTIVAAENEGNETHENVPVSQTGSFPIREANWFDRLTDGSGSRLRTKSTSSTTSESITGKETSDEQLLNENTKRKRTPTTQTNQSESSSKKARRVPPIVLAINKINALCALVKSHSTTPRKIKEGITELNRIVSAVKEQLDECQLELRELKRANENNENNEAFDIRGKLSQNMAKEEINSLIEMEWPPATYEITTLNVRDLAKAKATIKSTLVYPDALADDENMIKLAAIIPEATAIKPDHLKERGNITIKKSTTTTIPGFEVASTEITYIIQAAVLSEIGQVETGDCMNWANAIKNTVKETAAKCAEVFLPKSASVTKVRKMLECLLFGTDIKVLLRLSKEQKKAFHRGNTGGKGARTEAIIIEAKEGATFSEVVRELKQGITPDDFGVVVKKVRSTMKGNVKVELKETTPGGRQKMIEKINEKVTSAKCALAPQRTKGIVLMDLEDDIKEENVCDALKKEFGVATNLIKLNPLRKMRRGTQMITAFLPWDAAINAIKLGKIKIGWTYCSIKERCDPPFCTKCQRYGHMLHNCQEEVAAKRKCLRCGEEHPTKECKSEHEYCITCNFTGHRANSMKCPTYKQLVNGIKKQ